jgi:hypothetical protein
MILSEIPIGKMDSRFCGNDAHRKTVRWVDPRGWPDQPGNRNISDYFLTISLSLLTDAICITSSGFASSSA